MQKLPLISVVVPAFNAGAYLVQCIENIQYQTYKNIEIIVVDDGSTDDTAEIAKMYSVKLISQKNQGVSSARNTGLKAATGEFTHFMDPDDLINLDFFEKMVSSALDCDADMAFCGIINEREQLTRFNHHKFLAVNIDEKMALTRVAIHGYVFMYLFKTSFLINEKLLFDENAHIAEDTIFSLQAVLLANRIIAAPGAVYHYKLRNGSALALMNKRNRKQQDEFMRPLRSFKEEFEKKFGITLPRNYTRQIYYRFLGVRIIKKRIFENGNVRWYLFGICIVQRKEQR